MFFSTFLCLIIYFTSQTVARDVRIPLCTAWQTTGTVIIGSESGQSGSNEALLNQPTAIVAVDENNTLYVVDSGNNRLMKYEHGSYIGIEVNINGATLDNPQDVAIDQSGAMYISEAGRDRVVKWTVEPPNTRVLMSIRSPSGIYLDEATSELYVVGLHNDGYPIVMRYHLVSSKAEKVIGKNPSATAPPYELSSLYSPVGIHVDKQQRIYVVESGSHRITRWKAKESPGSRFAGTEKCSSASSDLCNPTSFILDDKGTAYIADTSNNRTLHWNATVSGRQCFLGCPYKIGNETIFPLTQPYDITFDNNFNFLVVEKDMNRIKRFDQYYVESCVASMCKAPDIDIRAYPSIHTRSQPKTFYFDITLNCYIWTSTVMTCSVTTCYSGDRSCTQASKLNDLVKSFLQQKNPRLYIMEIPPFALPVGTYKFSCKIEMESVANVSKSIQFTTTMIRSPINITLLPLGKSKITLGYQQEYTLSPKVSLIDTDPQSIRFVYYCRRYPYFNYTTVNGVRLNIDLDGQNPGSSTCFNLQASPGSFHYENTDNQSSLTIMSQSLTVNQIYELYVELYDGKDLVDKSDVILIEVQSQNSPFIEISPIFNTLILDTDYQLLNPSTQLLLESSFIDAALIQWKIYTGIMGTNSIIVWKEYNYTTINGKQLFYGLNSSFLTVTKDTFSLNETANYWQFVAIYTTKDESGSASVQLKMNYPPVQQYCAINITEGYTNESFTVRCVNWTDLDGIKDYSLHVISSRSDILMSIAYSQKSTFDVYLPSGDPKLNYTLNLIVHVRDNLGAWTESTIITTVVKPDGDIVSKTLNLTEDIVFDRDEIQLINSYAVILNQMALEDQTALMNKRQVQISDLIISTFETIRAEASLGNLTNASVAFTRSLNRRAIIREYLLNFVGNSSIFIPTTIEEIIIQSSIINQLTDTTSEWTQESLDTASTICNQFSRVLYYFSRTMTIEDVLLVVNSLTQCISNVFTGVNGPLQRRGFIFDHDLNKDFFASKDIEYDYTQYIDYEWLDPEIPQCSENEIKSNRICREDITDEENSNQSIYYINPEFYKQKLLARKLGFEIRETMFVLAKSIRRHLNMFQDLSILAPASRMFVEQIYQTDIENKSIDLKTRNASIYLPNNLTFHQSYLLGVQATLLPLAPEGGPADVKFSTVLTLSILDNKDRELEINATDDLPIEMFIPRDINVPIPMFVEENMTQVIPPQRGTWRYSRQFFIYYVNITQVNPNLTISVHLELKPVSRNISYFVIYRLDQIPAYNSTDKLFDGSAMLCDEILTEEMNYYTFYIDNIKTVGHKSLFFGVRELKEEDICSIDELSSITDEPYGFLFDYFIRIYSSGCYYLNQIGFWKSDGMKVGPKTNFEYTHCYSNHT